MSEIGVGYRALVRTGHGFEMKPDIEGRGAWSLALAYQRHVTYVPSIFRLQNYRLEGAVLEPLPRYLGHKMREMRDQPPAQRQPRPSRVPSSLLSRVVRDAKPRKFRMRRDLDRLDVSIAAVSCSVGVVNIIPAALWAPFAWGPILTAQAA